ncbi:hypothetical protein ACF0H5_010958 [Mactra antiquata]
MNFESASEIERKRQELRQARNVYLEKAKEEHEKEERKKERAKKRGEDKWMLASVDQRIQSEKQSLKSSKKKKKEKKKRKHKKKKQESSDLSSDSEDDKKMEKSKKKKKRKKSSSSSESDEEVSWVEKSDKPKRPLEPSVSAVKGPRLERDSWMQAPMDLVPTVTRKELIDRKNKEKEELSIQKELLNKPGTHAKELNPYWKDGGTGLPEEKDKPTEEKESSSQAKGLGDAGLSWLRKSYQRCVQQAEEEGRPLEELAAERWGSLKKIQDMLKNAEASVYGEKKSTSERPRGRFMKPSDDNSRRKYSMSRSRSPKHKSSDRYRSHRSQRSRSRDRHSSRRSRSPEKRGSYNDRRKSRSKSRERSRRRSRSSSRDRRSQRSRSRDRCRRRSRSRSGDRDRSNRQSSLKGRFMRPGEMSDSNQQKRNVSSRNAPAWKKKEFHKPIEEPLKSDNSSSDRNDNVTSGKHSRKDESRRRVSSSSSSSSSSSESSDSDSSSDEGQSSRSNKGQKSEKSAPVRILSEKEMNDLGAKIVKAEIMGNEEQAAKLKAQLEAAREAKKNAPNIPSSEGQGRNQEDDDFVTLTRTDRSGLARPVPESKHPAESGGKRRRKKQKVETHVGKEGERERYFDDDDKFDLKTLVEREKLGTAEDQNQMFARLAGRATQKTDDDFQVDDVFLSKANRKQSESIQEQRDRAAAIFEHKKMATSLEKCNFCFGNVPKHLIIAIGTKVYLCLPNHRSLTEGYCLIVPMQHVASSTTVDEDVWSEIKVFRRTLTKMFAANDEDVVFMETSMKLKQFPHMCIECVPMDKEVGDLAPIYFKKAIQESESEWSQNKKVVDLSQKDIRHSVPKGFPYFAVDFGDEGGFAHVIEDEIKFPHYFGREIIGGMVDADHRLWKRPPKENFDDQRKKVLNFAERWKPYDWTQNIAKKTDTDSSSSSSDSD